MNDEEIDTVSATQAIELWFAGWQSTIPKHWPDAPTRQWWWRAPARLSWHKGRFYRSTQQAYTAMRRSQ